MFIRGATLIFLNFLQVIYAPKTFFIRDNAVPTKDIAVQKFAKIERNQVLPLVLSLERKHLYHPAAILGAATLNRRMVLGTYFSTYTVLYFCPKKDSEETCLAPYDFQKNDLLECAKEATPMKKNEQVCGTKKEGKSFDVVYKICPNPEKYETTEIEFYTVCYEPNAYTMYTSHIITSPFLLSTYLLYWEHSMEYPITVGSKHRPSLLDVDGTKDGTITDLKSAVHPEKRAYKLQTLVPAADMGMALWRKTTYQNFNLNWQHEKLIPLWDKITEYVWKHAVKLFREKILIRVRTGVFDINSKSRKDDQMNNTWVKLISFASPDESKQIKAVAIMMNNFVGPDALEPADMIQFSNEAGKPKQIWCEQDSCMKSLQDEFKEVGGRVSCCMATQEILDLFDGVASETLYTKLEEPLPILHIPDINPDPLPPVSPPVNPSASLI